uniref:Uncharacterized protein n=1 Tax=Glycine max TaxID=3847 RepID=C6TB11_SOYBN|nr:unknown [Glycine max]
MRALSLQILFLVLISLRAMSGQESIPLTEKVCITLGMVQTPMNKQYQLLGNLGCI